MSARLKVSKQQNTERRRKPNKRSLVVDSDDELGENVPSPAIKRPRLDEFPPEDDEQILDVVGSEAKVSKPPKVGKGGTAQSNRRKRVTTRREAVDEQFDSLPEEEEDAQMSDYLNDDNDDNDSGACQKSQKSANRISKGKGGKGKGKAAVPKEIFIRDERKVIPPPPQKESLKSTKPSLSADESVSSNGPDLAVSTITASPETVSSLPPPKEKMKLPTIKKNKPGGAQTKSTITSSSSKLGLDSASTSSTPTMLTPTLIVRTPAANVGIADFDLRNEVVYKALFSSTGSSRAGHIREEERRRELNKLRDEARAKRAAEANDSFDLQEQMEKILRYEQRLRPMVLYPNILAARWKEDYERNRKSVWVGKTEDAH